MTTSKTNLPLIRLSAINPLLHELENRGMDAAALLDSYALPPNLPCSDDLFVASDTIYELVEECGKVSGDRHFGFAVGQSLNMNAWQPIADAAASARTVGELLTMFTVNAVEHSTATQFFLTTNGARSTFGFERVKLPPVVPAQNDAFYTGFMLQLLKQATGDSWSATEALFRVSDPESLPGDQDIHRVSRGDRSGVQISFPSQWLFEEFDRFSTSSDTSDHRSSDMPHSLLDSLHTALEPHLDAQDMTVAKAAKICGFDKRRLSRELRELGTTVSQEIRRMRSDKAAQALTESDQPIAEIAEDVGFTDATIFFPCLQKLDGPITKRLSAITQIVAR